MTLYSTGFNLIKTFHIIFVLCYFAGIFYLVRLFIYHTETLEKLEPERSILQRQYLLMENLLWRVITVPAGTLALFSGLTMLCVEFHFYLTSPWMHLKLTFILLLILYHLSCQKIFHELKNNLFRFSTLQLRMWNEVATLLLFCIVLAVVLKQDFIIYGHWIALGLVALSMIIFLLIRRIKRMKDKKSHVDDL
ncbi:MAG: CopD family protein [Flavobacteriales bacterium AspAUS03]